MTCPLGFPGAKIGGTEMADIEDAPRLRELCERAAKEYDNAKLIELIQQINDLLDKKRQPGHDGRKADVSGLSLGGQVICYGLVIRRPWRQDRCSRLRDASLSWGRIHSPWMLDA